LTEWSDSFVFHRKAILLVGGSKSGVSERQFYRDLIRVADARLNAHLKTLGDDQQCPFTQGQLPKLPHGRRAGEATITSCGSHHAAALVRKLPTQSAADRLSVDMASRCAAACRAAARPRFLNRRAWNVPVRTEHAAIARLRLQQAFASGTFIEISARVGWHCFGCLMPADWTGEHRDCSQSKHGRFNSSARRDNPRPSWREQARGSRPWRRHKGRRSRDLSNGCGPPYDETRCEAMRRECPFLCFHRRNPPFPFRPVRKFKLTHYQEIC
jgi:hypothetical protein